MHVHIVIRLLMFLLFVVVSLGKAYYALGAVTLSYEPTYNYLIIRDSIMLCILVAMALGIIYEIYFNCSRFNYRIKVIRE